MATKREKRVIFLAEKYGLSAQLTGIWLERNPKAQRPLLPSELRDLIVWARVPETAL